MLTILVVINYWLKSCTLIFLVIIFVHIFIVQTLHNVKYHPNIPHNERTSDYQDILMLCEHAILCLINPSEKAFVYIENNLPIMIQKHLLQGYVHHFDFERYFGNIDRIHAYLSFHVCSF